MMCERYWREGVVLAERGEPDPHGESCEDCRREHARCRELVDAIPMVAANASGDPQWQSRVWRQIARESAGPAVSVARRIWWSLGGAMVTAIVALIVWSARPGHEAPSAVAVAPAGSDHLPRFEIISGPVVKRSTSARMGDRVRISARREDDIRVYRAERLALRCVATTPSASCMVTEGGIVAETTFALAGDYQLVVIRAATVAPVGAYSDDLAAAMRAGGTYEAEELSIR